MKYFWKIQCIFARCIESGFTIDFYLCTKFQKFHRDIHIRKLKLPSVASKGNSIRLVFPITSEITSSYHFTNVEYIFRLMLYHNVWIIRLELSGRCARCCWFPIKAKITMLMVKLFDKFVHLSSCSNERISIILSYFFFFFFFLFELTTVSDRRFSRSDHVDPFSQVRDTRGNVSWIFSEIK